MALQIRRGTNSARLEITPSEGELLYTTDTKQVYVGDGTTAGGVSIGSSSSSGGTYMLSAESTTGGANIRLSGNSVDDDVKLAAGSNVLISRTDANTITIASTGTGGGTIYGISAETTTGGANIRLTGSDSTTDDLKIAAGSNVTITRTDANTITIASTGGGSSGALNDLTDVVVSSPAQGQVLKYDGTNWVNDTDSTGGGGSGSMASRTTASGTTASVADGIAVPLTITGFKGYALLSIQTSVAAWVTVYSSAAARTADATRTISTDPQPGTGVIAEVITTGAQTQKFAPATIGYSDEATPNNNIQLKVVNRSGSANAVTVTLKLIQLEA